MANPYGIEQVDVPGALAAYDNARQRRMQAMLMDRQIKREDAQLEREHNMLTIMAKVRGPGSSQNPAVGSYGTGSTVPADPTVALEQAAGGPAGDMALTRLLRRTPAAAAPEATPAATPAPSAETAPQSWLDQNQDVIRQLVAVDPDTAFKLSTSLQQMDEAGLKRVQQHNVAVANAAHHLRSLPFEQRAAERDRLAPDLVAQGVNQQEIARADLSDHGLDWLIDRGRDFEKVLEASKPVAVGEGTNLVDPVTGAVIASNPKPKHYTTFEVHNADGTTTPYGFDPETHQAFALSADGSPAGTHSSGGAAPDHDTLFNALIQQESGGRAGVVGPQTRYGRSTGLTQLLPQTAQAMAQKLGIPWKPDLLTSKTPEAAEYQRTLGRAYFDEGMAKFPGDVRSALMYYHGGPDQRLWGPKTHAYADAILARVGGGSRASATSAGSGGQITGRPLPANTGDDDTTKFIGGQVALGQPMPPLGMGKEAATMRRAILAEATRQWKAMGISPGEANVIAAQNKSGLAELARIASIKANVITAENTATRNAEQVLSLLGSTGSTGSPIFNAWQQAGRRATGDSKVSALDVAVKTLATEYARVMSGGGNSPLSDSARHEVDALLHTSMTADQFRAAIRQMKIDMANRSAGIEQERQATLTQIRTGGRAPAAPSVDEVRRGYRYKGGPPGSQSSWEKVQ